MTNDQRTDAELLPSEWAMNAAVQVWSEPRHQTKVLDADLALSVARLLVTHTKQLADKAALYLSALAELVSCKDLKDATEAEPRPLADPEKWTAQRAEYERRKPLAWEQAQALVKGAPAPVPQTTPDTWPECKPFFELMLAYRVADGVEATAAAYEAVKTFLRENTHEVEQ